MHEFDESIRQCRGAEIAIKLKTLWSHRANAFIEKQTFGNEDVP